MNIRQISTEKIITGIFGVDANGELTDDTKRLSTYISKLIEFDEETCYFGGFSEIDKKESKTIISKLVESKLYAIELEDYILIKVASAKDLYIVLTEWSYSAGSGGKFVLIASDSSDTDAYRTVLNYLDKGIRSEKIKLLLEDISDGELNMWKLASQSSVA